MGSNIPTDPFSAATVTYEGAKNIYVVYTPNYAPTVNAGSMSPAGTINTDTPIFQGSFADGNEAQGDKLNQFHIQVRRVDTGALVWDTLLTAGTNEQNLKEFGRYYGGTALVPGIGYEWQYRVSDLFGVWSGWSGWVSFTVNGGGSVTQGAGNPEGKQETQTPGPYDFTWAHVSGLNANAAQVRFLQNGTLVRQTAELAVTWVPGNTYNLTWAALGISPLEWGITYTYQVRAKDTGGLWSDWSAAKTVSINAYPTVPVDLSPANNAPTSSYPLLVAKASDTDDTVATGLRVRAQLAEAPSGAWSGDYEMTYNASLDRWELQTSATHLPTYDNYRWRAYSYDGTLASVFSPEATFTYAEGPVITQTAPADLSTITTNTPSISFTVSTAIQNYRVQLYSLGALIYDSGTVNGAVASGTPVNHAVPSGYLTNEQTYDTVIEVLSDLGLTGTLQGHTFTLDYPTPAGPINLQASAINVGNDASPSAVLLSWDEPAYTVMEFQQAIITRRKSGQAPHEAIILARLTSTGQNRFTDYYPVSGQSYIYGVVFVILQGTDDTQSDMVEAEGSVTLDHVVINNVAAGTMRAGLRYGAPVNITHDRAKAQVQPWGQKHRKALLGSQHNHLVSGNFTLHDDRYSQGADDLADLIELHEQADTVCWRDRWGNRYFGTLTISEQRGKRGEVASVTVALEQNDWVEGVS